MIKITMMMNMIPLRNSWKKCQSNRGASIVLALFAFTIITMVSMVIVDAAYTSAKSIKDQRKREQAYLSVNSAAQLLQKLLLVPDEQYNDPSAPATTDTDRFIRLIKAPGATDYKVDVSAGGIGSGIPEPLGPFLADYLEKQINGGGGGTYAFTMQGAAGTPFTDVVNGKIHPIDGGTNPYSFQMDLSVTDPGYAVTVTVTGIGRDYKDAYSVDVIDVYWQEAMVTRSGE